MSQFEPTAKFAAWANSFAGIDGGNIAGPIWFCGIEHGGVADIKNFDFKPVDKTKSWEDETARNENFKHQFDQKALKLYAALLGEKVDGYKSIDKVKRAFAPGSDVFKLNLYPLAFKNTDNGHWGNDFLETIGIPTKEIYRAWCQNNRFKLFRDIVSKNDHSLRLIICAGVGHQMEFLMAFGSESDIHAKMKESRIPDPDNKITKGLPFYWIILNNKRTVLAVVPFFGHWKNCLNSDKRIEVFADEIRKVCTENIGDNWLPK